MKFIVVVDNTPTREFATEADAEAYRREWAGWYGNRIYVVAEEA